MNINQIVTILFIVGGCFFNPKTIEATDFSIPLGARSAGMGNSAITLNDFWSVCNNPAGLPGLENITAGFYYGSRFLVKELSTKAGGFVLPTKSGVFGLNLQYFGYSKYNETKAGLAYGRSFGEKFSMGIQLDYLSTRIAEEYGTKSMITFELGIRSKLNENLVLAAHVFNPIGVKLESTYDERIPTIFRLGASYSISDDILLVIETEKDLEFKPLFRGGIEYDIIKQLSVRMGYSTLPAKTGSDKVNIASVFTFGIGLNIKNLVIDFAASMHQNLGWSPQISMYYKF